MSDNTELLAAQPAASMQIDDKTMEALVVGGDMSKLSSGQRLQVYKARCEAAGLDPRSQPFEYVSLQGKLTLYARKGATDQLAAIHGAKCRYVSRETSDDIHSVIVEVSLRDGRSTEEIGCVNIKGLTGDNLANARMKASSKAKRRAILSLCGLGMVDETELETVPTARAWSEPPRTLDALVAPKPPASPPAEPDPQAEPVAVERFFGIPCALGEPWEAWEGERIGGGNRNLMDLQWRDLVTTQDPGVLAAVEKGLDAARKRSAENGDQPVEARYAKLAMAWAARERAKLQKEAEAIM